uniref:Uncharacterized protein n=1 Tax=Oncorhynchus kisutch TaxID=8019 RepID=A0A8C7INT4_ONCKI
MYCGKCSLVTLCKLEPSRWCQFEFTNRTLSPLLTTLCKWSVEQLKENKVPGDMGLVLKSRAKHHAIASLLDRPFLFRDDALVVQYEVNFQDGIDCGGAYIKLLSDEEDLDLFNDRTSYTIMFGPDKCGEDYKLHFIFRHRSPLNKDLDEKHAKRPDVDLKKFYTDKKTHLYTLAIRHLGGVWYMTNIPHPLWPYC